MATYRYSGQAVVANDDILENATGGTFVDAAGNPIPIFDLNDNPITEITSSAYGQSSNFKADVPMGYIKFGSVLNRVFADEIAQFAVNAQAAVDDAADAQSVAAAVAARLDALEDAPPTLPEGGSANVDILWRGPSERTGVWAPPPAGTGSSAWDQIADKPSTFPPSPHTHTSGQVADATPVGRSVLTASTAQAARLAIGAGTGSGTSDLQLGATATTAAPGNHSHVAAAIPFAPAGSLTATTVQGAIEQAATLGGGSGGTSAVLPWVYDSGWPSMSATKPAGVRLVLVCGPAPGPTSYPSWMGNGTGQIPTKVSLWP